MRQSASGTHYQQTALPLIAMLPVAPAAGATGLARRSGRHAHHDSSPDLCIVDAANYVTTDAVYGATGRSTIEGANRVFIILRTASGWRPLPGHDHPPGRAPVQWSFRRVRAHNGPAVDQPTILGTPKVGRTLSTTAPLWTPGDVSHAYQWFRGADPIAGATKSTYQVQAGDVGASLSVQVTGSEFGFTAASVRSPAVLVAGGSASATSPRISDTTPRTDQVLTAISGDWRPSGVTHGVPVDRRSPAGSTKAVPGATGRT